MKGEIQSSDQPVQGRWSMSKGRIQRHNCDLRMYYQADTAATQ